MKQLYTWAIKTVAMLILASCSHPNALTPSVRASTSANATETPAKQATAGQFTALQAVVTKTKVAVEAGHFDQAQAEFGNFERDWNAVEDRVKATSPNHYNAIEDAMDTLNHSIEAKNKPQALAALQALTQTIHIAAKS